MDEPELHYDLRLIPAGRLAFKRWRYELWHGARLLATGWRTTEAHAERALATKAAHIAHRRLGPPRAAPGDRDRLAPAAPRRAGAAALRQRQLHAAAGPIRRVSAHSAFANLGLFPMR